MTAVRFQRRSHRFVSDAIAPPKKPSATPSASVMGPCRYAMSIEPWPGTAIPIAIEKPLIATTSSNDAAATTSDGMPLSTP